MSASKKLLLWILIGYATAQQDTYSPRLAFAQQPLSVLRYFIQYGQNISNSIQHFQREFYSSDKQQCHKELHFFITSLKNGKYWAFEKWDSFGKTVSSNIWLGSPTLCSRSPTDNNQYFEGQYCLLRAQSLFSQRPLLTYGVCLPKSCSQDMINSISENIGAIVSSVTRMPVRLLPFSLQCTNSNVNSPVNIDVYFISAISICVLIVCLVMVGTLYDVFLQNENLAFYVFRRRAASFSPYQNGIKRGKNEINQMEHRNEFLGLLKNNKDKFIKLTWKENILLSFSLYTNIKKLLKLEYHKEDIVCLNGLRALSIGWIIYGHTYIVDISSDNSLPFFVAFGDSFSFSFFAGALFAVDSFIAISGIVLSYMYLKFSEKGITIYWHHFYLDRILRISPTNWFLSYIILAGILLKIFQGPLDEMTKQFIGCNNNDWWRNLLYIQNSLPLAEMCNPVTWYLAVDMQLYIISPIFLYLMLKNERLAKIVFGVTIIGGIIWVFGISLQEKYTLLRFENGPRHHWLLGPDGIFDRVYTKPLIRIPGYLIGMLCGWLMFKTKCRVNLRKTTVLQLWIFALFSMIILNILLYLKQLSVLETALYISFHGPLWTLSLSIMIFLCCCGYGGKINGILSWKGWAPLSRLSFSTYLVHFTVLHFVYRLQGKLHHLQVAGQVFQLFNSWQLSILAAAVLYLCVELPARRIQNYCLAKRN